MARVNYDRMASTYDAGRAVPLSALEPWRTAVEPYVTADRPVLDVGSGRGICAEGFATWFSTRVIAVEPSDGMRRRAAHNRPHPLVHHLGAAAEHLPVRDAACGTAWLSTVIHHFTDVDACAIEIARTIAPDGLVLIRSSFAGRRALTRVDQEWAPSLRAYANRVRLRADTTLAPLTDAEFAAGMHRLDSDVAAETDPYPVVDGLDLLVLSPSP